MAKKDVAIAGMAPDNNIITVATVRPLYSVKQMVKLQQTDFLCIWLVPLCVAQHSGTYV